MLGLALTYTITLLAGVLIGQLGTWRWIRKRYRIPQTYAVHEWLDAIVEEARRGGI